MKYNASHILYYLLFVGIIIYTCTVSLMPDSYLKIYDKNVTKLLFITAIIFICLYDPVIAILIAIAFVVTLQKRVITKDRFQNNENCDYNLDVESIENPQTINNVKYLIA